MNRPSSDKHCKPCGFEAFDVPLAEDVSEFVRLRHRQRINKEEGAVAAMVADPSKLAAIEHLVETLPPDDPRVIMSGPALTCAQIILQGECEFFRVPKTGPRIGQLAHIQITR